MIFGNFSHLEELPVAFSDTQALLRKTELRSTHLPFTEFKDIPAFILIPPGVRACVWNIYVGVCGGQRTTWQCRFSPFNIMSLPGIELVLLGLCGKLLSLLSPSLCLLKKSFQRDLKAKIKPHFRKEAKQSKRNPNPKSQSSW